ncbi:MAG: hypothetical protein BWK79_03840 [Beggiatoa sp. IS2]|nr:MAG: hypothetical protein BWK79_03840 [Beggiatoa sp. IS2]
MNPSTDFLTVLLPKAVQTIDNTFGKDYAKEHPELVIALVQAMMIDSNTKIIARVLKTGLAEIAETLKNIALNEE